MAEGDMRGAPVPVSGGAGAKVPGAGGVVVALMLFCIWAHPAMGQLAWKRTYGGSGTDRAFGVRTTADDGAVVVGSTGSFGAEGDVYVIRIDAAGSLIWSSVLGGGGVQAAYAVDLGSDGMIFIAGTALVNGTYMARLLCMSDGGNVLWERDYGDLDAWSEFRALEVSEDGIIAVGRTFSTDGPALAWVLKADLFGAPAYSTTLMLDGEAEASGVTISPEGTAFVIGTVRRPLSVSDVFICSVSPVGAQEWTAYAGGEMEDEGRSIVHTMSGLVGVGYTKSFSAKRQMYMVRVGIDGVLGFSGPISSAGNDWEAFDVIERSDGTFAVAGYTKEYGAGGSDVSLLFINADGSFISGPTYGGAADEAALSVDATADGGYYLAGTSASYGPGAMAAYVIRSDGDTLNGATIVMYDPVSVLARNDEASALLNPNPVRAGQQFALMTSANDPMRLDLIDMQGRLVHRWQEASPRMTMPEIHAGIYRLQLSRADDGRMIWSGPVMVE